jgi:sensor domain DACNV-containing protein
MSTNPTYQAAKTVAPVVEAHFKRHLAEARRLGEDDLAPEPNAEAIAAIINATFWASFRPEEGRFPKISMAYLSPEHAKQPMVFEHPLPLTAGVLTKLAPAVERPEIHLGVWNYGDELKVWGTSRTIPSFCFVLEDIEPGLLVVKHRRLDGIGKYANVAVLKGEVVKVIDEKGTSLPDCPALLKALLAFTAAATNGPHHSLNVLVQLSASMRAHSHGGILLLVPSEVQRWRDSIAQPILYSITPAFSALSELVRLEVDEDDENRKQWESAVRRAVDTIGGMTAVDGATVINDRYEVLAFGAKIRRHEGSPPVDRWVITEPVVGNLPIVVQPTEHGGTRHLSAAQFVYDQREALALVASQDGKFAVFAWSPCEEMVHAHRVESLLM